MEKREKILKVSLKLFMEKGFNQTSIEEITKLVGISKGSFYTYFKSKEELLESIIESLIENVEKEFFKIVSIKKKNPVDYIESFLKLNLSLSENFSSSIFTIIRDVSFAPTKVREEMRENLQKKVNEKLKQFILLLKDEANETDILFLQGILLSLWVAVIFGNKIPPIKELSKRIWYGLGGEKNEKICRDSC